jgi:hypothetical protein
LARLRQGPVAWRNAWFATFSVVALLLAWRLVATALAEIADPPLWDFKVFWTVGHVAAAGHNVYDPASYLPYRALTNPTGDRVFDTIALGIGMPYPPPAIFLFYPLGAFTGIAPALALWDVFLFATLVLATFLFYREFFAADGAAGAVASTLLVLLLPATAATLGLGQLNFVALCLLLLLWRERNGWLAGCFCAPLLVLRPFLIILAVYYATQRKWNTLLATALGIALMLALSLPLVGWKAMLSYFATNPSARYPQTYFDGFESLYKIVSHVDGRDTAYFSMLGHPAFALSASILIGASVAACARAKPARRDACLAFLVALGLLLYPNTGAHYAVLLLPGVGVAWRYRDALGLGTAGAVTVITLEYVLMSYGANAAGIVFALDAALFGALALLPSPVERPATSFS